MIQNFVIPRVGSNNRTINKRPSIKKIYNEKSIYKSNAEIPAYNNGKLDTPSNIEPAGPFQNEFGLICKTTGYSTKSFVPGVGGHMISQVNDRDQTYNTTMEPTYSSVNNTQPLNTIASRKT